jgi:hypothetical protein
MRLSLAFVAAMGKDNMWLLCTTLTLRNLSLALLSIITAGSPGCINITLSIIVALSKF